MKQSEIRRAWLAFIVVSNLAFVGYLQYYQSPGGIVLGLPETWVALFAIMFTVFAVNSTFAWYYLGKPDIRQVFGGSPDQRGGA
jgi:hypothetical protein